MASANVGAGTCAAASAAERRIAARIPEPNAKIRNAPLGTVLLVIAFASGERKGS
jgi:hypothetical protein